MWRITYTGSVGAGWPPVTVSFTLSQIMTKKTKKRRGGMRLCKCKLPRHLFCLSPRTLLACLSPSASRLIILSPPPPPPKQQQTQANRWMGDHEVCITRREEEVEVEGGKDGERGEALAPNLDSSCILGDTERVRSYMGGVPFGNQKTSSVWFCARLVWYLIPFFPCCWHLGCPALQIGTAAPRGGGRGGGGTVLAGCSIHKASHSAINLGERWKHLK